MLKLKPLTSKQTKHKGRIAHPLLNHLMPLNRLSIIQSRVRPDLPKSMTNNIKQKNVPFLDQDVISEYIIQEMRVNGNYNKKNWNIYKATSEDLVTDITLDTVLISSPKMQHNLKVRSTAGHATEGHVYFNKNMGGGPGRKPNTTLEDIVSNEVLRELVDERKRPIYSGKIHYMDETQSLINEIADFLVTCTNSYRKILVPTNSLGDPLLGIEFFNKLQVDPQAVLKGYFFGAFFDNYDIIRNSVEKKFGVNYGGGEAYLANIELIKRAEIYLPDFKSNHYSDKIIDVQPHKKKIEIFKKAKILFDISEPSINRLSWEQILEKDGIDLTLPKNQNMIQQYIRTKIGRGGADDVLIRLAAFIDFDKHHKNKTAEWFNGLQLGAQLADILDTLEKSTKYFLQGGQDQALARFTNKLWLSKIQDRTYRNVHNITLDSNLDPEFALVDKDQIIYLTALGINPKRTQIHSSTKYFLKYQDMNVANSSLQTGQKLRFKDATELQEFLRGKTKVVTTSLEQEFLYMQNKLETLGCNMKSKSGKKLAGTLCPNSDILIGFTRTPFQEFIDYMDLNVIPYAHKMSLKPTQEREEFLKAVLN
ncbi:hypothetical protein COV13_01000 [Candidatus Woesearchaeota archaeon CG10_big_fil_rev_8_21_14_0_10_32_9]|nr:MAG: hypothetical protein COV13_01000 [Candidatus Woesearchaeota archaeon CG10_big_fil_rev_8_21_14_0_10_32_9]